MWKPSRIACWRRRSSVAMSIVAPPNPALVQLLAQAANAPAVQVIQPTPAITALPAGTIVEAIMLPQQPVSPRATSNASP
jgi:hypothetical protein